MSGDDGLREVLARQLWEQDDRPESWWDDEEEREAYRAPIDAVLALPELAALRAKADAADRVRELADELEAEKGSLQGNVARLLAASRIRTALKGAGQ